MAGRHRLAKSCTQHYTGTLNHRSFWSSRQVFDDLSTPRIPLAPKPNIDIRHIRRWPSAYEKNCEVRGHDSKVKNPGEIVRLFDQWKDLQFKAKGLRERNNELQRRLSPELSVEAEAKKEILEEAKTLKAEITVIERQEEELDERILDLAIVLPNLTSEHTPVGTKPDVLEYINEHPDVSIGQQKTTSHTTIGATLDILDFAAASTTSGWGFYYLKNEAALLEQALVQYALKVAKAHGFQVVTPPSMVYSHISSACGFQPKDRHNEQQVYSITQQKRHLSKPELSLAGTAEIPFAAMKASTDMKMAQLPLRVVGSSRCYRAEAGGRGVETKGLYRVHEFTKVEMFGWTMPDGSENELFDLMITIQKTILQSLGLYCRVLEQPTSDLGASAARKQDIEVFFPSRRQIDEGWGEVTSTSICTDYQTRRLGTRVRNGHKFVYPNTVNGTALAVPRVLAAILENHWDQEKQIVHIPKVLQPWMDGQEVIKIP